MSTQKPLIAVDLDDVLANEREGIRVFANRVYGYRHTSEDYNVEGDYSRYWERVWGVSHEEGDRRYAAYCESGAQAGFFANGWRGGGAGEFAEAA
jgi:hypothetical protein